MVKKHKKDICIIIIMAIFSIIYMMISTQNPFKNMITYTDSSVFSYIGKAMHEYGQTPYKDIFDHKGPLLHFINYLGYGLTDSIKGIWIIGVIFMTANFSLVFYISKLFIKNNLIALLNVMIFALALFKYYGGGNFAEEYALPFILISLYIFSGYCLSLKKLPTIQILITGMCFGAMIMLRQNMIAVWAAFCLVLVIYFIITKRYLDIIKCISLFTAGIIIASLPFIIYLASKSALSYFINTYWKFNFIYATNNASAGNTMISLKFFGSTVMIVSLIINAFMIFKNLKSKKVLMLQSANLFGLLLSIYLVISAGQNYEHYGMVIVPFYILPSSNLLGGLSNKIELTNNQKLIRVLKPASIILVAILVVSSQLLLFIRTYDNNFKKVSIGIQKEIDYIKNYTSPDDKILVLGNRCYIYLATDRKAASKYIYQFPIAAKDENINKKIVEEIKNFNDSMIILMKDTADSPSIKLLIPYLDELEQGNRYVRVDNISDKSIIYMKNSNQD